MHIWTETPMEEIWNQLRYFASSINVYNLLTGKIKSNRKFVWSESEHLMHHSREISSCIRQADEYFRASRSVGLATKPLLQFYGAQALTKAVILANDNSLGLQKLRYHGLSTRPSTADSALQDALRTYNEDPSQWQFENEYAVTNNGVFLHLARIVEDGVPSTGEVLKIIDLLKIIPDMAKMYSIHYGEPSHCFYLYGKPRFSDDGYFSISFSSRYTKDELLEVFPEFLSGYRFTDENGILSFRSLKPLSKEPRYGVLVKGAVAGSFYVRPHRTGIYKPITVFYALMFILSNIVRYKPAFWMDIIDGRTTGSFAIAEATTHIFARHFPNEVLEYFWHEPFTFGTPGYIS